MIKLITSYIICEHFLSLWSNSKLVINFALNAEKTFVINVIFLVNLILVTYTTTRKKIKYIEVQAFHKQRLTNSHVNFVVSFRKNKLIIIDVKSS